MESEIQNKPFDLRAALAGAGVVTRVGDQVTQLVIFTDVDDAQTLYGVRERSIESWDVSGQWWYEESGHRESVRDLFMEECL